MTQRDIPHDQGQLVIEGGTAPAAGAVATVTITANQRWRIRGIEIQLTTDATVASRTVYLGIADAAINYGLWVAPTVQTASLTYSHVFTPCNVRNAAALQISPIALITNIPDDLLLSDDITLTVGAASLQAGDQFTALRIYHDMWMEL